MLDRIAPPFVFILSNIVIYDPCQTSIQTSPSSPNQAVDKPPVDKSSEPILFPEDEDPDVTITFVSDAQLAVIAMLPTTALLEPAIVMGATDADKALSLKKWVDDVMIFFGGAKPKCRTHLTSQALGFTNRSEA